MTWIKHRIAQPWSGLELFFHMFGPVAETDCMLIRKFSYTFASVLHAVWMFTRLRTPELHGSCLQSSLPGSASMTCSQVYSSCFPLKFTTHRPLDTFSIEPKLASQLPRQPLMAIALPPPQIASPLSMRWSELWTCSGAIPTHSVVTIE